MKFDNGSILKVIKDFLRDESNTGIAELPLISDDYLQYYQYINKDNLQHLIHLKVLNLKQEDWLY